MPNTIANVLTGVATLSVGEPAGNRAEWSDVELYDVNTYSIKLSKAGTGAYGSTGVQFTPTAGQTIKQLTDMAGEGQTSFRHWLSADTAYWLQLELHYEDPNSESWVDVTTQTMVAVPGTEMWLQEIIASTDSAGYGGWSDLTGSFSKWDALTVLTAIEAAVEGAAPTGSGHADVEDWALTRVKLELWESTPARHCYVNNIEINGVTYVMTPGSTTVAGIELSGPYTEVGYTEDGVDVTYTETGNPIEVEEEAYAVDYAITGEATEITCNMAESSLFNIDKAMSGSVLSGGILKLGGGVAKKINLMVKATNPASHIRAILVPSCVARGAVGVPYKKGEKSVIPVTFFALKTQGHPAVTIVDNAA